jgi:hypothetical protein
MNHKITDTIKFLESSDDIDAQLEAFQELKASVTSHDLPVLLEALKSKTSNFAVRELLAEPIINLAGVKALPELMTAFGKNFEEGHDNDTFQVLLVELAETDRHGVQLELKKLAKQSNNNELEDINWLLEFCQ